MKKLVICLLVILPLSLFAQNEESNIVMQDSVETAKRPNGFIRAFNYLFNPSDIDTT